MRGAGTALAIGAGLGGLAVHLFARRAPWRRYPWYLAGLGVGIAGSEAGIPVAGAQVAAGAAAAGLGAYRGKLGIAGLALTAGTASGLFQLHRIATQTSLAELNGALADVLGFDRAPIEVPKRRRTPLRSYLAEQDIAYGSDSPAQVLDIWRRPDLPLDAGAGVLVAVHGGSWVGGNKRLASPGLLAELAGRGWVCVSIDYRLGPRNRWPNQIVDVKKAIAWVRANIAEHGGDPSFVAISGGSAGGHLAALAALTGNDPEFQPGFADADTSIQAAALLYGVYDLTARNEDGSTRLRDYLRRVLFDADFADDPATWRAASPVYRLHADAPPMFVVHGDRDEIVSVGQARQFIEAARPLSAFGYAELPYAHHAFDIVPSARSRATEYAIGQFLDVTRDRAKNPETAPHVDRAL
ncbi:MAG TPA: alpha/beta hydrolase [Pseudonocardiaceae bacterium]|nr:alpha/beta hydrolase [Pseudonocardiaceae bacterium]